MCDAVLFYYGEGNELWLRQKLREVQKSAAFGRKKPIVIKAIYVAPPDNSEQGQIPDARGDGHRPAGAVRSGRPDQLHQPAH